MKVTIEVTMDNDAFKHPSELHRVLEEAAAKVWKQLARSEATVCDAPEVDDKLLDTNGNTVGSVKLVDVVRCDECGQGILLDPEVCAFCEGKFCIDCCDPGDHEDCLEDE